jgi:putative transposase
MPRPLRIHLPDLIFHVLNRGNNRQVVFAEEQDYLHYLEILKRYKEKFNFKIFAYCLMTNHIHLLIKTSSGGTISQIMKAMTIAHTRHYHFKYNSSGHIWQGRFKSPIVSDDEYLLILMRYIEQNPVRAGMVDHPEKYLYSSYHINIKIEKDNLVDKEENPVFLSLRNFSASLTSSGLHDYF